MKLKLVHFPPLFFLALNEDMEEKKKCVLIMCLSLCFYDLGTGPRLSTWRAGGDCASLLHWGRFVASPSFLLQYNVALRRCAGSLLGWCAAPGAPPNLTTNCLYHLVVLLI